MQAPRILRRINRAVTNPIMSTFAAYLPPLAILRHVGRRSGHKYRTPVVCFEADKTYVIPLPYGTDTDWCLNVMNAQHCTLETGGRLVPLRKPRLVKTRRALPFLPALLRPGLSVADLPGYLLLERGSTRSRKSAN